MQKKYLFVLVSNVQAWHRLSKFFLIFPIDPPELVVREAVQARRLSLIELCFVERIPKKAHFKGADRLGEVLWGVGKILSLQPVS